MSDDFVAKTVVNAGRIEPEFTSTYRGVPGLAVLAAEAASAEAEAIENNGFRGGNRKHATTI